MAVRTREKLLDVAMSVFMQKGVENTTMADIAIASDRGRRTIYTYFKSKLDIYDAVIERESDRLVSELRAIVESEAAPSDKLKRFIVARLEPGMNTTSPQRTLLSRLRVDFGRARKVRRMASEKEEQMLNRILDEGVARGQFDPRKTERVREVLYTIIRSIDVLSVHEDAPQPEEGFDESLALCVVESLLL